MQNNIYKYNLNRKMNTSYRKKDRQIQWLKENGKEDNQSYYTELHDPH